MYLAHHVVLLAIARHWPQLHWSAATLAALVLTLAIAVPMRRWVELPCSRLRQRLHGGHNPTGSILPPRTASITAGSAP
jgi:peptidoglycan/LPS O-acetylase OafA/YrhL